MGDREVNTSFPFPDRVDAKREIEKTIDGKSQLLHGVD